MHIPAIVIVASLPRRLVSCRFPCVAVGSQRTPVMLRFAGNCRLLALTVPPELNAMTKGLSTRVVPLESIQAIVGAGLDWALQVKAAISKRDTTTS